MSGPKCESAGLTSCAFIYLFDSKTINLLVHILDGLIMVNVCTTTLVII